LIEGKSENDLLNGSGRSFYADGTLEYEGTWKNGLRHGNGKGHGRTAPSAMKAGSQKAFPTADTSYCHNGNKTYDGYWSAGKKNGYGRLYDKEGDIIENVLIGRGTCYFPENDEYGRISYTGSFANGMFDGHGTMNRKEGAVYKGSRKDGVRDCRIYNIGDNLSNQTTYRAISILT